MKWFWFLLLSTGCGNDVDHAPSTPPGPTPGQVPGPAPGQFTGPNPGQGGMAGQPHMDFDQGQNHPPIPATDPARENWDAGGFVNEYRWYGENSWADVRMRIAGHLSVIGRDRARLLASTGDLAGAANLYLELAEALDGLDAPTDGPAAEIISLLRAAAHRDHELLIWLASDSMTPPLDRSDGLDGIRQETLAIERWIHRGSPPADLAETAQELQAALLPYLNERPDLAIDAFEDFDSRHELRIDLFDARMDALDPLGMGDPWGYWQAEEIQRQAHILGTVLAQLTDGVWAPESGPSFPERNRTEAEDYRLASQLGTSLWPNDRTTEFTPEGVGRLPTGDTLIDVAAQPGPLAIGTLERLGFEDPEHRSWIDAAVLRLNETLATDPDTVPEVLANLVAELDRYEHGSRYYNIKQLRNEGVRVLARSGRFALAGRVLQTNYPLRNHDWAVPNRQGILEAIAGRLQAHEGETRDASATLEQAWQTTLRFLEMVNEAETAGPGRGPGSQPPMPGPTGGPPPR